MWIALTIFIGAVGYLVWDLFFRIRKHQKFIQDYDEWLDEQSEIQVEGGTIIVFNRDIPTLQSMDRKRRMKLVERQRNMIKMGRWKIIEEDGKKRLITNG